MGRCFVAVSSVAAPTGSKCDSWTSLRRQRIRFFAPDCNGQDATDGDETYVLGTAVALAASKAPRGAIRSQHSLQHSAAPATLMTRGWRGTSVPLHSLVCGPSEAPLHAAQSYIKPSQCTLTDADKARRGPSTLSLLCTTSAGPPPRVAARGQPGSLSTRGNGGECATGPQSGRT